jgi:biopolymer transport protein ExbD
MNFNRKKREKLDINLISMIDILFVLLLFFVISTTFTRHTAVNIKLPEANGEHADQQSNNITLNIDVAGSYYLQSADTAEPVSTQVDDLTQQLQHLAATAKQQPLIINADGKSPHQAVITALEAASTAGFSHISFAAQKPNTAP